MQNEIVFRRVEMDVIDVSSEVGFVADTVFPEAALPKATFSLRDPGAGLRFIARLLP